MNVQEILSRGKTQIALLLTVTVGLLLSVIFYGTKIFLPLILISILVTGVFFTALVVWGEKAAGKIYQRFGGLESQLIQVTKDVKDSVLPSTTQAREAPPVKPIALPPAENPVPHSMYDLAALPPTNVLKTHSSGVVGRAAANMTLAAESSNFATIVNSNPSMWKYRIATIASPAIENICRDQGFTVSLMPFQARAALQNDFHFVVVDEQAFYGGPWSGCLETAKMAMFMELYSELRASQKRGAQVILIRDDKISTLTNTLRNCADILINPNYPEALVPYQAGLTIVKSILEFKTGKGEYHV